MKRQPRHLTDITVIAAIVALVGVLVLVQALVRHGGSDVTPAAQDSPPGEGLIQHSTLGPAPTPSPSASASVTVPPATPSATATRRAKPRGPVVPPSADPDRAMASLAQQAERNAKMPLVFRLATFNVLGASHTTKRGDSRIKRSYDLRMNYGIQVLAAHKADVVGFQEFETPQARLFEKLVGPVWGLWPTAGGSGADGRNSIGYAKAKWELVKGSSLTIPYFNGVSFHTPMALLRNRSTGVQVWFINVHNAADTAKYHNQGRWREAAVARELAAVAQLSADGTPVVLMGDMNSRDLFYCTVAGSGLGMTFPNPGSGSGAGCTGPTPSTIDWMLGTRSITWSGYVKDRSSLTKLATDHPVYSATATVAR